MFAIPGSIDVVFAMQWLDPPRSDSSFLLPSGKGIRSGRCRFQGTMLTLLEHMGSMMLDYPEPPNSQAQCGLQTHDAYTAIYCHYGCKDATVDFSSGVTPIQILDKYLSQSCVLVPSRVPSWTQIARHVSCVHPFVRDLQRIVRISENRNTDRWTDRGTYTPGTQEQSYDAFCQPCSCAIQEEHRPFG